MIYMSEVSGFHHGIDTQLGMMTKSIWLKRSIMINSCGVGGVGRKGGGYMGYTLPL